MDCKEVYEKLELLLDGELSEHEKQRVFDHINDCKQCDCKSHYEAERCFKEYIQRALFPKQVPPTVIEDIRAYVGQVD